MSPRDVQEPWETLYGEELSPTRIFSLTDAVDDGATAWHSRPLESVWPIVYFDGLVVHVRGAGGRRLGRHLRGLSRGPAAFSPPMLDGASATGTKILPVPLEVNRTKPCGIRAPRPRGNRHKLIVRRSGIVVVELLNANQFLIEA